MMNENLTPQQLAQYIDHTLLRPDASEAEILKACGEAVEHRFKGLCIESKWLPLVAPKLKGTGVLPVTVISFPHGTDPTDKKVKDAQNAVAAGALEVDMVLNRTLLESKNYAAVLNDIRRVVESIPAVPVKVILETSELSYSQKVIACGLAKAAGAKFVKTSTGFSKAGATVEDVRLMRETVGTELGVKASGGVRSYDDACRMIEAGASRLGTSAGVAIVQGAAAKSGSY